MQKISKQIYCDICEKEIKKPIDKEYTFVISSDGRDIVNRITFKVSGIFPYCTANPDFCKDCLKKYVKKWLDTL